MSNAKSSIRLARLFLVFTLLLIGSTQLFAQAKPLARLRALLLLDEQAANIGISVVKDGETVQTLLKDIFKSPKFPRLENRVTIDVLRSTLEKPLMESGVAQYFIEHPIADDEALFIYYSGHGGRTPALVGGHFLAMSGGDFLRSRLVSMVEAQNPAPKLRIIMTDACNDLSEYSPEKRAYIPITYDEAHQDLYERLFLGSRGTMDFNSSEFGQVSWSNGKIGGYMTAAFDKVLREVTDTSVNWSQIFTFTVAGTKKQFETSRDINRLAFLTGKIQNRPKIMDAEVQIPVLLSLASPSEDYVSSVTSPVPSMVSRNIKEPVVDAKKVNNGLSFTTTIHLEDRKGQSVRVGVRLSVGEKPLMANEGFDQMIEVTKFDFTARNVPISIATGGLPKKEASIQGQIKVFDSEGKETLAESVPFTFTWIPRE